jgi:hypothetical protein
MSKPSSPRTRIDLDLSTLDDADRAALFAGIQKVAAGASLAQIPSIQASLTALDAKAAALDDGNGAVAADRQQLQRDITVRDLARVAFDAEVSTLRALVANNATSPADVTAMGFSILDPASRTRTLPDAPREVVVRFERRTGRARVTVVELSSAPRGAYVAESSPDPIGPSTWSPMVGNGKQRLVTGASGAKVWVRFAQVRYGLQSAWSAPVLVTFP